MERRKEPRYETEQPATVTVLSEPEASFEGFIVNVSGRGMGLQTPVPVPLSAPVRVEIGNQLYLGEICFCRPAAAGIYLCGVRLEHVLEDLGGLAALARRVSSDCSLNQEVSESLQIADARQH